MTTEQESAHVRYLLRNADKFQTPPKVPKIQGRTKVVVCDAKEKVSKYTMPELRAIIKDLKAAAEKQGGTTESDAEVAGSTSVGTVALFNGETQDESSDQYFGPYKTMKETINRLSNTPEHPSTATVPFQYELIRAFFSRKSPLKIYGSNFESIQHIDDLIFKAAQMATDFFSRMVEGWKDGLVQISEKNGTKFTTAPDATAEDFWNWNPSKLSYRAFAIIGGENVPSFCNDFLGDFVSRPKGANEQTFKDHELCKHPFIKEFLKRVLESRNGDIKRGSAQLTAKGKKHRHPCIGPLEIHDYRMLEFYIDAAYKGCDVAKEKIDSQYPGKLDEIIGQHKFELEFVKLCDTVNEAYAKYPGNFEYDETGFYSIFCLTSTSNYKGGQFESSNCVEMWYIQILRQLMIIDNPTLKQRNYFVSRNVNGFNDSENLKGKRHLLKRSNDQVYSTMSARINGWVEAKLIGLASTFYLNRARAFQTSDLIMKNMSRADMNKYLGLYRNAVDSFDDVSKTKFIQRIAARDRIQVTSLNVSGSLSEEANLESDAVVLTIVVIGREETKSRFKTELENHKIAFPDEAIEENPNLCCAVQLIDTESDVWAQVGDASSIQEKIDKAEQYMSSWFSLRQRCNKETLLKRIKDAETKLNIALRHATFATEATKLVKIAYELSQEQNWLERKRINKLPTGSPLSNAERLVRENPPDVQQRLSLLSAVKSGFTKIRTSEDKIICSSEKSLAAIVGQPPNWNWETEDQKMDKTSISQSRHTTIIKRFLNVLEKYKSHISVLGSNEKLIDFVSPLNDCIELITKFKVSSDENKADFIGFAASPNQSLNAEFPIKWAEDRIDRMLKSHVDFLKNIASVVYFGFLQALEWAGVFSSKSTRLSTEQKPRMGISVLYIVKTLSIASVSNAICTGDDTMSNDFLFSVSSKHIKISSVESIIEFAKTSKTAWNCLCAIASFTQKLLVFNRTVIFDERKGEHEFEAFQEFATVSFSADYFLVFDDAKIDELRKDVSSYLNAAAPEVVAFPPKFNWSFSDEHWTNPAAFRLLITWLPESVHQINGFFTISGVRDRPDKKNGFLNVHETIPDSAKFDAPQYWDGLYTHTISMAHGRLPTPPSI